MELLLLSQFNLDSKLPTFFELYVQSTLTETLGDVFRFLHALVADTWAPAALLLPYSREMFTVLWSLVERSYLLSFDCTFAECFYELKRVSVSRILPSVLPPAGPPDATLPPTTAEGAQQSPAEGPTTEPQAVPGAAPPVPASSMVAADAGAPAAAFDDTAGTGEVANVAELHEFGKLTHGQRMWSLLSVTLLPYLRSRLHAYYKQLQDTSPDAREARAASERAAPWLKAFNFLMEKVYPYIHFVSEMSSLCFAIGYIFGKTVYFSPSMWAAKITLRRFDRSDYAAIRQDAGRGRTLRYGALLIMTAVLGMRFLQWWGTAGGAAARRGITGGAAASPSDSYPVPPPPEPAAAPSSGIGSVTPGRCPICANPVANPAVNVASGYVFCYPCIQHYVELHGCCPVSRIRTTLPQIRRLYEA